MTTSDTVTLLSLDDDPARADAPPEVSRLLALAAAMTEQGQPTHLLTRAVRGDAGTASEDAGGPPVDRLDGPAGPPGEFAYLQAALPGFVRELEKRWTAEPPATVLAHGWASGLAARSALDRLAHVHPRPATVIVAVDAPVATDLPPGGPRLAKLEASVAAAADAVLVGNTAAGERLARRGVPRRLLHVLPHPLQAPEPPRPAAATRVVTEVAVLASRSGPPASDDPAVAHGMAVVHALGEALPVVVPAPPARPEDDPDYWPQHAPVLDEVAVVLHLPEIAVTGHAVLAAMDRGAAVVASDVGAHRDIIEPGVSGLLVDVETPARTVRVVRQLLEDPFLGRALGAAAQDRARSRHEPARVAAEVVALVRRLRPEEPDDTEDDDPSGDDVVVDLRLSDTRQG